MKTIKIMLEYKCFPTWIYDENDIFVDNDLPEDIAQNKELDAKLVKLQEIFDSLYIDTPSEFSSRGFKSFNERAEFISLLFECKDILEKQYGSVYKIECKYSMESFPIE